ncbi:MAG: glycosyltransferase [Rhodospirillales bacterium]|nr:MAG: glycosyltransferase [Rhodospirillales bacterium]
MASSVSVMVVPRERFSAQPRTLQRVAATVPAGVEVVVVDAGSPPAIAAWTRAFCAARGWTLIRSDAPLMPNAARNLALERLGGELIVTIDNDATPDDGWIEALVECAEATGAAMVGPLTLIGRRADGVIHMAGGACRVENRCGARFLFESHHLITRTLADAKGELARARTEHIDLHAALVRRDFVAGGFDEGYLVTGEHIDLCLRAGERGAAVFHEPRAVVTYGGNAPMTWRDLRLFALRWNDDWTMRSLLHLQRRWALAADDPYLVAHAAWCARNRREGSLWWREALARGFARRGRDIDADDVDVMLQRRALDAWHAATTTSTTPPPHVATARARAAAPSLAPAQRTPRRAGARAR